MLSNQSRDVCGNCIYYTKLEKPRKYADGLCSKHPRLNQKVDDLTNHDLWCEYHTWRKDMSKDAADSEQEEYLMKEADRTTDRPEDYILEGDGPQDFPPYEGEKLAVLSELDGLLKSLQQFDSDGKQAAGELLTGSLADMMELRGMMKHNAQIRGQLEHRIKMLEQELKEES